MGQSLSGQIARARRHSWTKGLDLPNSDRLDGAELNRRFNSAHDALLADLDLRRRVQETVANSQGPWKFHSRLSNGSPKSGSSRWIGAGAFRAAVAEGGPGRWKKGTGITRTEGFLRFAAPPTPRTASPRPDQSGGIRPGGWVVRNANPPTLRPPRQAQSRFRRDWL